MSGFGPRLLMRLVAHQLGVPRRSYRLARGCCGIPERLAFMDIIDT